MMLKAGGVLPATNISTAGRGCFLPISTNISPLRHGASPVVRLRNPKSLLILSAMTSVPTHAPFEVKRPPNHELADKTRLGGMAEDGLSYTELFIVRSYEVGPNKTITIQDIVRYLQDAGCNQFLSMGYSIDHGFTSTHSMKQLKLILVFTRMHLEIYKYPAWSDVIEIETWFQIEGSMGFRREWILKDYSTGVVIGRATGKLLLMNQETRRFHKVVSDIRDEIVKYTPKSPRHAFLDENKVWLKKIEKPDDPPHYSKHGLEPRPGDIDMNDHVNNVTYIGWLLESISEVIKNYELQSLTIDYKKECRDHEVIDSLAIREPNETGSGDRQGNNINGNLLQFRHSLRLSSDGSETNRARSVWRKKN